MTYKGAIKQLYEMRDNIWMPVFFKPYFDKIIETLTDDVRENVRGYWKKRKDKPLQNWYQCSNCGAICGETPKYCSECGAYMRGDKS